MCLSTSASLPS
jgi:hypothetical protein